MNGLIVVTHPDDDALFAAPYQLAHPYVNWIVLSVTHGRNSSRFAEMQAWQSVCRSRWTHTLGFEDTGATDNDGQGLRLANGRLAVQKQSLDEHSVCGELTSLLGKLAFDIVLTHNSAGEYGHPDHAIVHRAVREWVCLRAQESKPSLLLFGWGMRHTYHTFTVTVPTYVKAAMKAYPSQANVIKHMHAKIFKGCCGMGRYTWDTDN